MPVATRPSTSAVFELKSAALTLVAVIVKTPDLAQLAAGLVERLADTPGLFDNEPVVVDVSPLRDDDTPLDFAALAALLRGHGMLPVAVKGGSATQMAAALDAGFAEAPEGVAPARAQPPAAATAPAGESDGPAQAPQAGSPAATPMTTTMTIATAPATAAAAAVSATNPAAAEDPTETPAAAAVVPVAHSTRVVDRPLRSGQQVYARDADLVVMAAVSFGAEVIADGHIHVYAPLRGRAIAGAKGNADARIFTTCMEPQLISIAGIYRTTETELPADVLGKPAQVRLEGDRLVVEPLTP